MKYYKIAAIDLHCLIQDSLELEALTSAGVDNWSGCEYAYKDYMLEWCEQYNKMPKEDEDYPSFEEMADFELERYYSKALIGEE